MAVSRSYPATLAPIGVYRDDAELLDAVIAGNVEALGALYGAAALGLSARILRNPSQTENVVQEVFLQLRQHAGFLRKQRAAPASWLLAMVRRRAVDVVRRDRNGEPAVRERMHLSVRNLKRRLDESGPDERAGDVGSP